MADRVSIGCQDSSCVFVTGAEGEGDMSGVGEDREDRR